jgi:hypothetical protein
MTDPTANNPFSISTNHREHTLFFDLSFSITKDGADLAATARKTIVTALKEMGKCDSSLTLYEYSPADPQERKAITDFDKLPKTMDRISRYIKRFRVQKHSEYIMYTQIRIGFNAENLPMNARAHLDGLDHSIWEKALQHEDAVVAGFIFGAHQKLNIKEWVVRMKKQFYAYDIEERLKEPLQFSLRWKSLFDGTPKDKRPTDWKPTYGMQVEVPREHLRRGKAYIKAFLESTHTRALTNLKLRLLPTVQDSTDEVRARRALDLQKKINERLSHELSTDFPNADIKNREIRNAEDDNRPTTLREVLLSMTTAEGDTLFLSVEKDNRNPNAYWITFSELFKAEAKNRISGLYGFLYHKMGYSAQQLDPWFPSQVAKEGIDTQWDAATQRMIAADSLEIDAVFEDLAEMSAFAGLQLDMSIVHTNEAVRPTRGLLLDINLDVGSVATQGTTATNHMAARLRQIVTDTQEDTEDTSTLTPSVKEGSSTHSPGVLTEPPGVTLL